MGPSLFRALPPVFNVRRYTYIYFDENQLSRGLISLSLLSTAHPKTSQGLSVRSFTLYYQSFNLAMDRSPPFRVSCPGRRPIQTRFRYAFALEVLKLPKT